MFVQAALGASGTIVVLVIKDSLKREILSRVVSLISGVIDVAIIVLLARRSSSDYFHATPEQRGSSDVD